MESLKNPSVVPIAIHRRLSSPAGDMIEKGLAEFDGMEPDAILNARRKKFLAIGRNL